MKYGTRVESTIPAGRRPSVNTVAMTLQDKLSLLKKDLSGMEQVIIAYSGGVDSTFLLKVASLSGLRRIIAVTSSSESLPVQELDFAIEMASSLNIAHRIVETRELDNKQYADNPPDRCYHCKKELYGKLKTIARQEKISFILDGTNSDDIRDWRPGRRAAAESGVLSPLVTAGLGKEEIRKISRCFRLPTWNKPATPCLSSRFPYGQKITSDALGKVNRAEQFIKNLGVKVCRVRVHGEIARVEVAQEDIRILTDGRVREEVVSFLKGLGYRFVTLDLQGFRSGSLNESLPTPGNGK